MTAITPQSPSPSIHLCSSPKLHQKPSKIRPPIFISTYPSHLKFIHLRDLLLSTNLSCHTFPLLVSTGRARPVDLQKLCTAVRRSSVIVSVFCSSEFCLEHQEFGPELRTRYRGFLKKAVPVSESNGHLVGFGRAVSDSALTDSIYDVVVSPSLQGLGIGSMIIKRIIRLFFEACRFGEDALGSTMMMYTQTATSPMEDDPSVKRSGSLLLLVPPLQGSPNYPKM